MTWKPNSVKDWIALASIVFAFGVGWNEIQTLKGADAKQEKTDARQDGEVQRLRHEIRGDMKELHRKLDRLMERK